MGLRIASDLPDETEQVIERVIGCSLDVHRTLGPGFLERIYVKALALELEAAGLPFEQEREIVVMYRGTPIRGQRVDLIVASAVILEVKSVAHLDPVFQAKMISYLRTTGLRAGLIVNFNSTLLRDGVKRVVL